MDMKSGFWIDRFCMSALSTTGKMGQQQCCRHAGRRFFGGRKKYGVLCRCVLNRELGQQQSWWAHLDMSFTYLWCSEKHIGIAKRLRCFFAAVWRMNWMCAVCRWNGSTELLTAHTSIYEKNMILKLEVKERVRLFLCSCILHFKKVLIRLYFYELGVKNCCLCLQSYCV